MDGGNSPASEGLLSQPSVNSRESSSVQPPALSESDIRAIRQLRHAQREGAAADALASGSAIAFEASSESHGLDYALARRSRNSRRAFLIIWTLLALFALAFACSLFTYVQESQSIAQQQGGGAQPVQSDAKATGKSTEVPCLSNVLGMREDAALAAVARGGEVVSREPAAVDDGYDTLVQAVLTEEKSTGKNGPLMLYLGLDAQGKVVMVGYRAPFTVLGYGSYSFIEAVEKAGIIPQVLQEAGIAVEDEDLRLPEDEGEYSVFDNDGTTKISQERLFFGKSPTPGVSRWEAILRYDFTEANAEGNLAYTRRSLEIFAYAN